MIKIEYEAGVDTIQMYVEPEEIMYIKKTTNWNGDSRFMIRIKGEKDSIGISEKVFEEILSVKQSLWRDKQINSILND